MNSAPDCSKCGAGMFFIPGQLSNIGWLCPKCDAPKGKPVATLPVILPPPPSQPVPAPVPAPEQPPSRDSATIPTGLPHTSCVLRAWVYASALSARYFGLPVYIVGGALTDPNPRDVDIVIPMPDDLFLAAYGDSKVFDMVRWESGMRDANPPAMWLRWARDCAKQSRAMTMFCARVVDFKTQPETYFKTFEGKPRVRLDCGIMREDVSPQTPATTP